MPKPLRVSPPDSTSTVEVVAPRTTGRRRFSVAEKQRILKAAAACAHGELGALLRREGIYHSQLQDWRAQQAASGSQGLRGKRPGPAPKLDAKDRQIVALNSRLKKLERELVIVNGLVELQKKMQAIVSAMQPDDPSCTR
jgi:transposase-like protein